MSDDADATIVPLPQARAQTLRDTDGLVDAGLASPAQCPALDDVAARYAIAITPAMADLIDPNDPQDPIARQFVPDRRELVVTPHERADPIGDHAHSPVEGIVHRYPDRVLLKLVHVCAVYCRFCFRREMVGPGAASALGGEAYARALDYIRTNPAIWEVILTGGDPLVLSPRRLREVMSDLADIAHVKVVRIHSRVPVVDPQRMSAAMVDALRCAGKAVWVALHVNHPRELTDDARAACARIIDAGIPMVSQSVLLRGVNDSAAVLEDLMRALVAMRIKPYYLHHGDLAPGTSHLRTTIAEGRNLMAALRGRVSGLCQPDYVLDIPGGHGKVPLGSDAVKGEGASYRVRDYCGEVHLYRDETDAP